MQRPDNTVVAASLYQQQALQALVLIESDTLALRTLYPTKSNARKIKKLKESIQLHYQTFIRMMFAIGESGIANDKLPKIHVTPQQQLAFNTFKNVWDDQHQITVFNNQEDKCELLAMPTHPTNELLKEDCFFASEEDRNQFAVSQDPKLTKEGIRAEEKKQLESKQRNKYFPNTSVCNSVYVWSGHGNDKKLFYVNKSKNVCKEVKVGADNIEKMEPSHDPRVLTPHELAELINYTNEKECALIKIDRAQGLGMDLKVNPLSTNTGYVLMRQGTAAKLYYVNELRNQYEEITINTKLVTKLENMLGQGNYQIQLNEDQLKSILKATDHRTVANPSLKDAEFMAATEDYSAIRKDELNRGLNSFVGSLVLRESAGVESKSVQKAAAQPNTVLDDIEILDTAAYEAIVNYKNKRQQVADWVGKILGGFTAFIFGAVEAGTGIAIVLPLSWPILAVYAVTIPLAALAFWVNYEVFIEAVPAEIKKYIGKEKWFDGVKSFRDPETGQIRFLKKWRIRFIALFTLLSIPTGIAIGALGSTGIMLIQDLPLIGLVVKASPTLLAVIASPFLMYVTIGMVCITMALMLNSSITLLLQQNKKLGGAFEKPFKAVAKALKDNNASLFKKVITYTATVALSLLGLVGLAMACFTSSRSIGMFLMDKWHATPLLANRIGNIIAMGPALLSRFWWTLRNMLEASVVIFKGLFSIKKDKVNEILGNNTKPANEQRSWAAWSKEKFAPIAEAFEEAFFYFIALAKAAKDSLGLITFTALVTGIRTFGTNIRTLSPKEPDQVVPEAQQKGVVARQAKMTGSVPQALLQQVQRQYDLKENDNLSGDDQSTERKDSKFDPSKVLYKSDQKLADEKNKGTLTHLNQFFQKHIAEQNFKKSTACPREQPEVKRAVIV